MPETCDALCDRALNASKLAEQTHAPEHHKAAKQAHEQAYQAASAAGRPSLAQSHLQAAAKHDKHQDPTTPEGKSSAAHLATQKARTSGKPEDHDAAANAHDDASKAQQLGHPAFLGEGQHGGMSHQHKMTADKIRNPQRAIY